MLIVVSYNVANDRRRTRLAQELENFGRRVQYSVFECLLDARQLERLRTRLLRRTEACSRELGHKEGGENEGKSRDARVDLGG